MKVKRLAKLSLAVTILRVLYVLLLCTSLGGRLDKEENEVLHNSGRVGLYDHEEERDSRQH